MQINIGYAAVNLDTKLVKISKLRSFNLFIVDYPKKWECEHKEGITIFALQPIIRVEHI